MQKKKVTRGGSWFFGQDFARTDFRLNSRPYLRNAYFGFRVCKKLK